MTSDEPSEDDLADGSDDDTRGGARARLGVDADRAIEGFDQGIVDLLAWFLDTETRARIYIYLRKESRRTSEEIAEGTGLYPSTVRESLAELHDEGIVTRVKRESEGAGNNPYEYEAIAPSELVSGVVGQMQDQLNTICNLDRYLGREADDDEGTDDPIRIEVHEEDE